jgi:hypothetical protein
MKAISDYPTLRTDANAACLSTGLYVLRTLSTRLEQENDFLREALEKMRGERPLCENDGMGCPACELAERVLTVLAAQATIAELDEERDKAVAFAAKCERGEAQATIDLLRHEIGTLKHRADAERGAMTFLVKTITKERDALQKSLDELKLKQYES